MLSIFDFATYPKPDDFDFICKKKKDALDKISLQAKEGSCDLFEYKFNCWLYGFNNRACDLKVSYAMMVYYKNYGIPDNKWHIPGDSGKGIQYFPDYAEETYAYHYWFSFYLNSCYSNYFSLIDNLFHIINIKYDLGAEFKSYFRRTIFSKLRDIDRDMYNKFESFRKNEIYKKAQEYRNDIEHNYKPDQINSVIKDEYINGRRITSLTIGNYVTTDEFIANIEESIDLLARLLDEVRDKLSFINP